MTLILCARVSWPVPAVRVILRAHKTQGPVADSAVWRCSWCGARVKVVA